MNGWLMENQRVGNIKLKNGWLIENGWLTNNRWLTENGWLMENMEGKGLAMWKKKEQKWRKQDRRNMIFMKER